MHAMLGRLLLVRRMHASPQMDSQTDVASELPGSQLRERERIARELMGDMEVVSYNKAGGSVKRKTIGDSGWLDTAEGAPPEIRIQFHHELAYARNFPKYVSFGMMVQNTTSGGLTQVVDSVKMTAELSPALRAKMK